MNITHAWPSGCDGGGNMLKLLVVDDEYNIREGLAKTVDWQNAGVECVAAAESGAEALALFDRHRPDIIITDIFMDEMSGLDLIEAISGKSTAAKFILISGYDEFAYARKAIDLKVFRYLLKPIVPEEILAAVQALAEEIHEEQALQQRIGHFEEEIQKNREILIHQFHHDILYGHGSDAGELRLRAALLGAELPEEASFVCAAIEADGGTGADGENPYARARMLSLAICRIAGEVFHGFLSAWAYPDDDNRVYVVAAARQPRQLEASFAACVERLQKAARQNLGIAVSAGVGQACGAVMDICRSRAEALRALDYKMAVGPGAVIHIRDVQSVDSRRFVYPVEQERRVLDALAREDGTALEAELNGFFRMLSVERLMDNRLKAALVKLHGMLSMKLQELNLPPLTDDVLAALSRHNTLESARLWFQAIAGEALARLSKSRAEGFRSVIHSAERFIQANYANMELSLAMVAEHLGLTPSYFSRLFKQETGTSYIDYVINLRIEHAKRLLLATTHRIFDIGEMVGYPNSQYFCTLFRKSCGVSPAEFREGRDCK